MWRWRGGGCGSREEGGRLRGEAATASERHVLDQLLARRTAAGARSLARAAPASAGEPPFTSWQTWARVELVRPAGTVVLRPLRSLTSCVLRGDAVGGARPLPGRPRVPPGRPTCRTLPLVTRDVTRVSLGVPCAVPFRGPSCVDCTFGFMVCASCTSDALFACGWHAPYTAYAVLSVPGRGLATPVRRGPRPRPPRPGARGGPRGPAPPSWGGRYPKSNYSWDYLESIDDR